MLNAFFLLVSALGAAELRVDFARPTGKIRPLHGANCGTICDGGTVDLTAAYREAGIPLTRLHDCHWPNPDVVDVSAVFPRPEADPERPESYDFRRTDEYLRAIASAGTGIVYRLGESIEHTKVKYRVHPPRDPAKWAAVCIGILRHYLEGWAGGPRLGIRYWEIWNEPENRPAMWTGTPEEYYRLYEVAAKAIKARFPDVLVGGPSIGDTGRLEGGEIRETEFLAGFFDHVRRTGAPLDFFSWHTYTADPAVLPAKARAIRALLDRRGFPKAESHLNEWNYLPGNDWGPMVLGGQGKPRERFYAQMGGAPGAAFTACVLAELQDVPLDVSNYYRGDAGGFGLFTEHGVPRKSYFVFVAFRRLLEAPDRVEARGGEAGKFAACAGLTPGKDRAAVLIANFASPHGRIDLAAENLPWDGASCEVLVIDDRRELEVARKEDFPDRAFRLALDLPAPSVALVRIARADRAGR